MGKRKRFYINVWDRCNLNCKHCFNEGGKASGKVLTYAEIMRVLEEAQSILGIEEVQLTGGEPTQRPDFIKIITGLQDNGLVTLLQTNGAFNNSILNEILKLSEKNTRLIISLDGLETNDYFRGQGSTQKTISNMNKLSAKFDTRVNILLSTKIAWEEIERIADLAQKLNLTLAFNPLCPSGRADSSYLMGPEEYFDWMYRLEDLRQRNIRIRKNFDLKGPYLYENEQCPVRKGDAIHVHADGSVYPCGFLVNLPECFMGSVREKSLAELVNTIPQDCQALANLCINCPFFNQGYCHGGCPARIYALNHRFDRVDIYCLAEYFQEKSK